MISRRAQSLVRTITVMLLIVLVVGLIGFGALRVLRTTVDITEAVEGPVVQAFYSTGTISPVREFPIRANIAGTIERVAVDKGDRVKIGDELAFIHEPALQFAFEKARAELEEKMARADPQQSPVLMEFDRRIEAMSGMLEIAAREQKRQTAALESNAGSQADLDRAMDRVRLMTMDVEATRAQRAAKQLELAREIGVARAAVDTAKWNLEQQTLRSPIEGVVLDRPTSKGTRVAVNDTIMRVADVKPVNLVMRAAVDEEDVARVDVGQLVRLTLYAFPGDVFTGRVAKIYDQADIDRRTFEVDVKLDHPNDRLLPGMTGELAFIMAERAKATVIPSQAVHDDVVWVIDADGAIARREVKTGLHSVERTEITQGISPGDKVVLSPIGTLKPGSHVGTRFVDPSIATGLTKKDASPEGQTFRGIR